MMASDLTRALRQTRPTEDDARMSAAVKMLARAGMLSADFVRAAASQERPPPLFDTLVALGRGDLSVARLYEGHVNALQLIVRLGTSAQRGRALSISDDGGLLGIWGADDPSAPARIDADLLLSGRKLYASGADMVGLAVVAVKTGTGQTQLLLFDASRLRGRFDPSWWRASGMTATRSFALDLSDLVVESSDLLGAPSAYEAQPFFGGGAVRFVAAQLGGALAVWDAMREHLTRASRHEDPHQAARLALAVADLEAAYAEVSGAYGRLAPAIAWEADVADADLALIADAARVTVEEAAERVLSLAVRSVGCAGLMETHPLNVAMRDLQVYLRQPAPDAARVRLGRAAAAGLFKASFDDR